MHFTRHHSTILVAAGIVSMAALGGAISLAAADANDGHASVFVPITPCRLFDTRPAPDTVGARSDPVGPGETIVVDVTGSHGDCTIPGDATAVAMNATAVDATAASFATFWPAHAARPTSSNLNYVAGQAPTPNKVDVKISPDGELAMYNAFGTVHLVGDVLGYYTAGPLARLESGLDGKADADAVYTKAEIDALLAGLADAPAPAASVGYTDAEIDAFLATKADVGSGYTDAEIDAFIDAMASEDEVGDAFEALGGAVYTRDEIDAMHDELYTQSEIDNALSTLVTGAELDAILDDRITLIAGFNGLGNQVIPGPYTTSRQLLGHYRVTLDVGLLDLPTSRSYAVVATSRCDGTTVANTSRTVWAVGAYMDEIDLDFRVANVAGIPMDCGVDVLVRFAAG